MSGLGQVWLVAKREMGEKFQSKSFVISSVLMVVMVFAGALLLGLFGTDKLGGDEEPEKVAAVGELAGQAGLAEGLDGFEIVQAEDEAAAEELVRSGEVAAALVPDKAKPLGLVVLADEEPPDGLVGALTVQPEVRLLTPRSVNQIVSVMSGMVFAIVFFFMVLMYGQVAAQTTVVEKQTRVIELLLAAVRARALLAGKLLSNTALAFGTMVAMFLAGAAGLYLGGGAEIAVGGAAGEIAVAAGKDTLVEVLAEPFGWFLLFFLVAFVMYSALMVGSAATVSRLEDVGNVLMPTTMLIMVPYFMVVMFPDNKTMLEWLSFIPFSAPTAMPIRLVSGGVAAWEVVVSLALLVLTTYLAILAGGRLYEGSVLRTGARVKFKEALKGAA
jgi:ABC-2 type transport system permease protein